MLEVTIPQTSFYDEANNLFIDINEQTLTLEHSLVSIEKWEAKWHVPFLSREPKTYEQTVDYIRCMTLTKNVDPLVYRAVTGDVIEKVNAYIDEPMTATTFSKDNSPPSREIVTAELVYYWMTALNIPYECRKWHFNRLMTLVRVCNLKNSPGKKMSKRATASRNRELNRARRNKYKTKG